MKKRLISWLLFILVFVAFGAGCSQQDVKHEQTNSADQGVTSESITAENDQAENADRTIREDGRYSSKEDVAMYIHLYGELPDNFITKKQAEKLGWESDEANLWEVTDQMSIGGDRFGNREGLLPNADERQWYECDINYKGGYRGAERIVYSNDGLIYYTKDHYESFEQLY